MATAPKATLQELIAALNEASPKRGELLPWIAPRTLVTAGMPFRFEAIQTAENKFKKSVVRFTIVTQAPVVATNGEKVTKGILELSATKKRLLMAEHPDAFVAATGHTQLVEGEGSGPFAPFEFA